MTRLRPVLPLAAVLLAAAAAARGFEPISLDWIGEAAVERVGERAGEPVGGLSSLVWDESSGEFLVVSDDRSEEGPARFYRLRVDLSDGRLDDGDVHLVGRLEMTGPDGRPFPRRGLDPEGLALAADALYLGSEGEAKVGLAPFVAELDRQGRWRRALPLRDRFLPLADGSRGVRDNLGFESVAISPDGAWLFAAAENALVQDGPATDAGVPSPARLLRWRLDRPDQLPEEFLYRVEAVRSTPPVPTALRVNGLVDLVGLSATRLLALERQYVVGSGIEVRLYLVDLEGASEVSERDGLLDPELVPVRKWLLLDLADLGIRLDNLEGVSFGPELPDGRRSMVLIADDNFNPDEQVSQVLAFAVDDAEVRISGIQGAGHRSPLEGRWVGPVEGFVTAIADHRDRRGFWMESFEPDGDPATSEGIFVEWEGAGTLAPGAAVRVGGRVVEKAGRPGELTVTTLRLAALEELSGKLDEPEPPRLVRDLPLPAWIDDDALTEFEPEADAIDLWESVEGMRVEVPPGDVIGPTSGYGDLVVLPDGVAGVRRTAAGGLLLQPAGPPASRVLLSGPLVGGLPDADVGARLEAPALGIVDYAFAGYRLNVLASPSIAPPARPRCAERTDLEGGAHSLTIASFNVENLSVAGPPERFERIAGVVVDRLAAPALVALQEIQDDSGPADDGTVTARATLEALTRAISAAGGPRYDALWIDPENGREGGQPGGNIRVALLADPLRVTVPRRGDPGPLDGVEIAPGARLDPNPGRVAPASAAFSVTAGEGVRRSLAVEVEFAGEPLYLVVNHLSSKYEDGRDWGAVQPPVKPSDAKRVAQAEALREFAEALLALEPGARLVLLGDLNDFEWSPAVTRLAAPPFENLIGRVFETQRYNYNFQGGSQVLDHVVVSPALADRAEIDVVHVNADCADARSS
ncbi:MAG TPA: esterase-like activity of phytase family protein, partial [Thermoanaerobaculia bacterium]|nr:esterase-like activity of phytase family protein [Thermoanaerobaculia bacterium]